MKDFLLRTADAVQKTVASHIANSDISRDMGMGADGTPTVFLDKVAEDTIIEMVAAEKPDLNILSEEAGFIDNGGEKVLVTDPVDGTYNAICGIPYYAVSLAVGKKSLLDVETGVVKNLVSGDTFLAEKGKGAFLNGKPIRVRKLSEKQLLFNIFLGHRCAEESYELAKLPKRVRDMGSAALEIVMVAAGQSDLFYMQGVPRQRNLRVVDIAAAALILREAGGELYDETHKILDMDLSLFARSPVVAVGDEDVWRYLE